MKTLYNIYYVQENGTLDHIATCVDRKAVELSLEQLNSSCEAFYDEVIVDDGESKWSGLAFMAHKDYYIGMALKSRQNCESLH